MVLERFSSPSVSLFLLELSVLPVSVSIYVRNCILQDNFYDRRSQMLHAGGFSAIFTPLNLGCDRGECQVVRS